MHSTALLEHDLDDHLLRILAAVAPDRVRSERLNDDATIRMRRLNAGPRSRETFRVDRQVRHLHRLGLVVRDGYGWSRTAAGNALLKQRGGAS